MKSLSRLRANYRSTEVRGYVEELEELREKKDTKPGHPLRTLLYLLDVERCMADLPLKERQALLLIGQVGISQDIAGRMVGVTGMTMSRRYRSGMERLVTYLNGAR